ncbi:thyrotropin-releasing hormone receptor-like [Amphiura filiformis]|uniref:thyrotropin-releasing hormone receptor-like n=1 Tax=Amphiura filiformis TaxID=82378 RepID=UPI003B2114AB
MDEDEAFNDSRSCTEYGTFNLTDITVAEKWLWNETDFLIVTVIIPLIVFIGVFGNGSFLFTILRLQKMKSSLNAYLFNLAVCDIIILLQAQYWYTANYLHTPVAYRTIAADSKWGCTSYIMSTHPWYFAGIELNTVITVERYLAICAPLRHRAMVGLRRTIKLLIAVWTIAVLTAITVVPQYWNFSSFCLEWPDESGFQSLPKIHTLCNPVNLYFMTYGIIIFQVYFVVGLVFNSVLYAKIIIALSQRSVAHNPPSISTISKDGSVPGDQTAGVRNQVARTLVANSIIFFICQVPQRIAASEYILDWYNSGFLDVDQYSLLNTIGYGCLILNSIINPYMYVGSCQYYRNAMKEAFNCCK